MGEDTFERRKRSKWDDTRGDTRGSRATSRDQEQPSGRSRWDDRRSRSPRARSRSPPARTSEAPPSEPRKTVDPAAAAAAAAAKINASIQAKRGVQHVDVPPIRSSLTGATGSLTPSGPSASPPATSTFNSEMYIADGDYIKDIEVNDLRNRYTLTKGATQKMIKEETGADVTTRGAYYPDKSMATTQNPPLYLHITSTTKEGLEKAVSKIEELMKQELPNLVDERRFRRREPPEPVERDEYGRRKWPEEKIPVGLEPIPGFNLRASVVGHGGSYVKHIQQETRCRVQIKGKGSGFREHNNDAESEEPLYLHVTGPDAAEVQRAKELCEDLVTSVRQQYEEHKAQPQPIRFSNYGGGGGGGGQGGIQNPYPPPAQSASPQIPSGHDVTQASATPAAAPGTDPNAAAYANPYAAYYAGGVDPYAAYGGYAAYAQYYQQYYGAAAAAAASPVAGAPPGTAAASPPPGPPGAGAYSAVRPPPGM